MKLLIKCIATFFFVGEVVPWAPGTAASAVALLLFLALGGETPLAIAVFSLLLLLGFLTAGPAEKIFGRKDPRQVVIDEAACLFFVYAGIPLNVATILVDFLLYRLMDILKPFPARRLERLRGGWGIMLDDLVAGVYAQLLLRLGVSACGGFR